MFLKPIVPDACSKNIQAQKPTKQNINAISTRCFMNYYHYFVNVDTEIISLCFQKGEFLKVLKNQLSLQFLRKETRPFLQIIDLFLY